MEALELQVLQAQWREKYLHRLNDLPRHTLEGANDIARVRNSRYLIENGIEPTEENLKKLQEEIKATIKRAEKEKIKNPLCPSPRFIEPPTKSGSKTRS